MATDSRSLGTKQVQFKKKEMIEWDEMLETKNKQRVGDTKNKITHKKSIKIM